MIRKRWRWMSRMQSNSSDFHQSSPTVAVIGLGKIGLPLAVQYAQHGYRVIGCDINLKVVEMLNAGQSHVQEEPELDADIARLVEEGLLWATVHTDEAVRLSEVVVVIVPVVVDAQHRVNYKAIDAATETIAASLQPGTLVVYETTFPVGTTSSRLRHILEHTSNFQAGKDFYLAYRPRRASAWSLLPDLASHSKIRGGID